MGIQFGAMTPDYERDVAEDYKVPVGYGTARRLGEILDLRDFTDGGEVCEGAARAPAAKEIRDRVLARFPDGIPPEDWALDYLATLAIKAEAEAPGAIITWG